MSIVERADVWMAQARSRLCAASGRPWRENLDLHLVSDSHQDETSHQASSIRYSAGNSDPAFPSNVPWHRLPARQRDSHGSAIVSPVHD